MVTNNDGSRKTFSFDKVYTTEAQQEEVTLDLVIILKKEIFNLYKISIFYMVNEFTIRCPPNHPRYIVRGKSFNWGVKAI